MECLKEVLSPALYERLQQLGNRDRIEKLKDLALSKDVGPELTAIQDALVKLYLEERAITDPLESARDLSISREYDVLITDITESDFQILSMELGVQRLAIAENSGSFPVQGVVYGSNSRMFVPMVVTKRSTHVHAIFLYDTGSPSTYLRKDTMESLGYKETIPDEADVFINGVRITVRLSRGHFENVDLLGQDLLEKIEGKVVTTYRQGIFQISRDA